MKLRITEQSHPITRHIDQLDTKAMIACLFEADRDLFRPSDLSQSLAVASFQQAFHTVQAKLMSCLAHPHGRLIMGGAGTSGRLALIAALQAANPQVMGLLAGGVDAFFKAKENVEDAPQAGIDDIDPLLQDSGPVVYIGISCGLSAAYVAGQIHRTLQHPLGYVVLIGFNPASDANQRVLPTIDTSMAKLTRLLIEEPNRGQILNPIIGPEPITGSTRMKGGSATKIILDSLIHQQALDFEKLGNLQTQVYRSLQNQAHIIEAAGSALAQGGKLIYWSSGDSSLFTMLDASECPPTFGAATTQVWSYGDATDMLPGFDTTGFLHRDLPESEDQPCVLVCTPNLSAKAEAAIQSWAVRQPQTQVMVLRDDHQLWQTKAQGTVGLTQKWFLNAISTLAFVKAGKVYGNRMIDLRISNQKLWDRAQRIIAEIAGITCDQAQQRMLQVLEQLGVPGSQEAARITRAKEIPMVPLCILLERYPLTLAQAQQLLQQEPRLALTLA